MIDQLYSTCYDTILRREERLGDLVVLLGQSRQLVRLKLKLEQIQSLYVQLQYVILRIRCLRNLTGSDTRHPDFHPGLHEVDDRLQPMVAVTIPEPEQ